MRILFSSFFVGSLLLAGCAAPEPEAITEMEQAILDQSPERLLRHVVLFSFKDSASAEEIKSVEDAFRALPAKVEEVYDFEWGTNNSPEGINDGFTHCFFVTFLSEEDRAVYLPHPEHQAFIDVLRPHLEKALVVDYWTTE